MLYLEKDRLVNPITSFPKAFHAVNEELQSTDIRYMTSGTTVVAMYVNGFNYWIAWAGDSRAIKAQLVNGTLTAVNLSHDHKPDGAQEKARILSCGGFVGDADEEGLSARVFLDPECTKVGIAVSRSIGDFVVKNVGVTAEPDVAEFTLENNDKFFVLASDGVWEFLSSQVSIS